MELRCLRGHFLGEMAAKENLEIRLPCFRCRCGYLFTIREGRLMVGLISPPDAKPLPRSRTEKRP